MKSYRVRMTYVILLLISPCIVNAAANHQTGAISNITSTTSGLLVRLDSGLPDNCLGTAHGWMLIKKEHTTIIAVLLAGWSSEQKDGVIYTTGIDASTGYCLITQWDPVN